ncbi:MAG: cupin domain-containing protein [SAR202 cluster bacterium]|nr:cupin domain-containing protein [SAR202 cluster bacterium]
MRVIRISEIEYEPVATATPIEGWTGGQVKRTRQTIIPANGSKFFNASVVNFGKGATTGVHTHASDQILVVTAGIGFVSDESGRQERITVGDVVHIRAGEKHVHGATKDSYMSHITITAPGS